MIPNVGDLGIFAQIGCVVHNKECSQSSIVDDSFNMLFLCQKPRKEEMISRCLIGRCQIGRQKVREKDAASNERRDGHCTAQGEANLYYFYSRAREIGLSNR